MTQEDLITKQQIEIEDLKARLKENTMERLPMVTVEFKNMPYFRCLLTEWKEMGGYKGFLKEYGISISIIKKVRTQVLKANEYPTSAWEG